MVRRWPLSPGTPTDWREAWRTSSTSVDPDVLVLGGGLSQLSHLYEQLPPLMAPHIFADQASVVIKAPRWGDASGTRGAARLWDLPISQQ